jgi:hypothetical protein
LSVENPQLTATIFNQSSFAQTAQRRRHARPITADKNCCKFVR